MDLEAENRRLRALLAERDAAVAALTQENEALRTRVEAAEDAAARLERELELLRRRIVGPSSERVVDPNQLPLPIATEERAQVVPSADEPASSDESPESERRKDRERRGKRGRASPGRRNVADMNHLRTF